MPFSQDDPQDPMGEPDHAVTNDIVLEQRVPKQPDQMVCKYVWNRGGTKLITARKELSAKINEEYFNSYKLGTNAEVESDSGQRVHMKRCYQYLFIKQPTFGSYTKDIPLSKPTALDNNGEQVEDRCDLVWDKYRSRLVKRSQVAISKQVDVEHLPRSDKPKRVKPTVAPPTVEAEIKCRLCDMAFSKYPVLTRHLKNVHNEEPEEGILCFICGKSFANLKTMSSHLRTIHDGGQSSNYERQKQVCEICSAEVSNMWNHMSVHQTPRHSCEFCGKLFRRSQDLNAHVKSVHAELTNQELLRCEVCCKTFALASYLKRHMRTHTQERRYKCVCGEGFNFNVSLKAHKAKCVHFLHSAEDV